MYELIQGADMYTILYKSGMRIWDITKAKLHSYILTSDQDIEAIFEQSTPVTKRIRQELASAMESGTIKRATPAARQFINSHP